MALADPVPPLGGLILKETRWRQPPQPCPSTWETAFVIARWSTCGPAEEACDGAANANFHVLELNLRPTDVALAASGAPLHDGRLPAGSVLLTEPGDPVTARYRNACDLLHLFVPIGRFELLLRAAGLETGRPARVHAAPDPVLGRLALSLLAADEIEGAGGRLYVESLASAILARVLGRIASGAGGEGTRGLVKWRQRRVIEFMDANLSEPIRLPDLARAAGLSRMHFAAQFRAATGVRPHDFLVRRRIERAQEMLRDSFLPLAQVALGVGFQTQAHFTTVFREHVHETPGRWRQLHRRSG